MGDKLLQDECVCAGIRSACREGRSFQGRSLSQQPWALPGVNLTGREHVESRVRMHVVVPRIELAEVAFGDGRVGKETGEDRLSLDGRKVRFDVGIVVGGAWSAEQLLDAEFLEVGHGGARAHLGPAVAE